MSKPYTAEEFSSQITGDRTWRLREISDLKNTIRTSNSSLRKVLLRAITTICYAHWEGYVRFTARKYLEHISLRRVQYGSLDRQFLKNYFLPRLAALSQSKTSLENRCDLIDEILNSSERRFSKANNQLVNTQSNLSYGVFAEICRICCVDHHALNLDSTFIDAILLKRRNAIAHGEDTFVEIEDLDRIADDTVSMMRAFGDALDNQVCLKSYMVG